ncbi:MAG TPA: hypothetical protein VKR22_13515, partial [Acidimicrobiales bacterium]|nr:hypothetical protein [Acidimicrobiales bacterium]
MIWGLLAAVVCLGALSATPTGLFSSPVSTSDPPADIYPNPPFFQDCSATAYDDSSLCVSNTVQAIDNARAQEGVGPMGLPSDWSSLSPEQQMFVATNLERTARGLTPLSAMATRLDQSAESAAAQGQDTTVPSDFPSTRWSSNWAGGGGNSLENIYIWMYDDGPGSGNASCQQPGEAACWVHRHNILVSLACQPCVIGSGFSATGWQGGTSWTELLADTSGSPQKDFTWSEVVPYLPDPSEAGSSSNSGAVVAPQPYVASSPPPRPSYSAESAGPGHRMVASDGGVFDFGSDPFYGSLPGIGVHIRNIVGMAGTPDGRGYWLVGSDGGVFAFGDAPYLGSVPGLGDEIDDIVGIAPTRDGGGYWMVGSDGGVFGFGDATYHGSIPGEGYRVDDIVGVAATPDGGGYWLVGRRGEVWTFGDARFFGSPAASRLPVSDIVGMAAAPQGGYWLVGSDGGIFGYGPAGYHGSVPGARVSIGN